jgi:hypothetical protein
MSSTRHAQPGSQFNQERFASSPQFERGLNGYLVARRCELLERAKDRDLVWFLQAASHAPGGLKKLAADVIAAFPDRVSTATMQKIGAKPGQSYSAKQVLQVREEIGPTRRHGSPNAKFPLKGDLAEAMNEAEEIADWDVRAGVVAELKARKDDFPDSYPAEAFTQECASAAASELEKRLTELCLDPDSDPATISPWYFPGLAQTLRDYQTLCLDRVGAGAVITELGRELNDALDCCKQSGFLVLVSGQARTGKTFAAKAWCQLHPGRARYVQTPASNDDISFFRVIAEALGLSSSLSLKGVQLRERIERTLQCSKLMLVLDEAHYLWPQNNRREALPNRITWLMTALVNYHVPVALITTPQFHHDQKIVEKKTGWNSQQFDGRIGLYRPLPEALSLADLEAVARSFLPAADSKTITMLAAYADVSLKSVASIESAVAFARMIATKEKRRDISRIDIARAIQQNVIPSDTALSSALAVPAKGSHSRAMVTHPRTPGVYPAVPARTSRGTPAERRQTDQNLADPNVIPLDEARHELKSA